MTLKVYLYRDLNKETQQLLDERLDKEIELVSGLETPDPADFEILVAGRPTEEQITASSNLKAVVIPWAGIPEETSALLKNYPQISLHNLHHNAHATAETAIMLLMAAAKLIVPIDKKFRENNWVVRYEPNPARLLDGKTMLIIGFGQIGQHVGRVCQAMGIKILATRRNPQGELPDGLDVEIHKTEDLNKLVPRAEILMVTAPLTDETRGMIGKEQIELLPEGAIVVNVGRGAIIDETALYEGLKSGKLHSAGIDVWYSYPEDTESRATTQPSAHPFDELDNVVMSPHRGGGAVEIEKLRMAHLADLLNNAARGEKMPNKIDLEKGY